MSLPPRPLNVSQKPAASDKVRRWEESQLTTQGFPPEAGDFDSTPGLNCRFPCADETSIHLTPEAPAIEHDKSMTVFSSARTRAFGAASMGLG